MKAIVANTVENAVDASRDLFLAGAERIVIKGPFSSSGRNTLHVGREDFLEHGLNYRLNRREEVWLERQLSPSKTNAGLLIEEWVERLADVSLQSEVTPDGRVRHFGVTRFFVNHRGQYRGHFVGRSLDLLSSDVLRAWYAPDDGCHAQLLRAGDEAGIKLARSGYVGPYGIDAFVYRDKQSGDVRFQSLCEVNLRYTMGRIALELSRYLAAGVNGLWLHLTQKDLAGESFAMFAKRAVASDKMRLSKNGREWSQGVLFTNDPATAQSVLTMLVIGRGREVLSEILGRLGLSQTFRTFLGE